MKITIAIDSFKGSLSSLQAGYAAKKGILDVYPDAVVSVCALADGGEGTTLALTEGLDGKLEHITVTGPLGKKVDAFYGVLPDGTAVIEMAAAAGITLINDNERNPLNTTTFGVGELILDAVKKGCRKFIIGIGGSATNDGGIGMLTALGYKFLDAQNKPVSIFGNGLEKIAHIDDTKVYPELKDCTFKIACDVTNPLCGDNGCSAVYGPQKGATPKIISDMDLWLRCF
ncbi:MAG: glycerate kinase, partial [Clostridia bacterium]|nr:glycerate kinase [Clostridia bacterium]